MTPDEAYNIGFLAGCAEAGLDGTEAIALHEKTAATKQADGWGDMASNLVQGGLVSALGTGTLVGGGIGAGLGVLARPDPLKNDNAPLVRNLQQAELIAALQQHANRARQTAAVLRAKAETPQPRSVFGI
jgi:hypothetical protein